MNRLVLLSIVPLTVVIYAVLAWKGPDIHWRDLWITLISTILLAEGLALLAPVINAPLSKWVWRLRDTGSGLFSLLLFTLGWMAWHFLKEGRRA